MTENKEESRFSDKAGELDLEELKRLDAQHVTLAQAIEQAQLAQETTLKIKGEVIEELERFRAAMASDFKGQWIKPDRLRDLFAFGGIGTIAVGIAVAFHWSYSLIAIGAILLTLSLIPLFRTTVNP
jgi:type II secretory pathway pseudopilin PulG